MRAGQPAVLPVLSGIMMLILALIVDGEPVPHLFAVFDLTKHPAEAHRRGAQHRGEAGRTPEEGWCSRPRHSQAHLRLSAPLRRGLTQAFAQRESVITQLSRLLESEASLTSSALKQNNLSLLREKLASHERDLTRLRSTLQQARDRANLLSNVRSDINEYRANNPEAAEAEYMLDERNRVDNSHNMMDSTLSQAYAVNDSFLLQRETLASINRKITSAASHVPGINTLIGRISAKKRRDGIIMGCFVAFCFLVFWWLM